MFRLIKLRRYAQKWIRTWRAIDERRNHVMLAERAPRSAADLELDDRGDVTPVTVSIRQVIPSINITHAALTERGVELGGVQQVIQSRVHAADVTSYVLDGKLEA